MYVKLHCRPQNDFFIEIGSDESHLNVFMNLKEQSVTRRCPQTTTFEEKGEPTRGIDPPPPPPPLPLDQNVCMHA